MRGEGIDRALARDFARALGHVPGPWEPRRMFMDDLFLPEGDESATDCPLVPVMTCTRCGAQLPDDRALVRYSLMLGDWCPWLLILMPERRAEAAAYYRRWCAALGQDPEPWAGDDGPIPLPDEPPSH